MEVSLWPISHIRAEPRMDEIDLGWVRTLFLVGLTIVVLAQLLAFVLGPMTPSRFLSMLFGITAVVAMTLVGQLASARIAGVMVDAIGKMEVGPPVCPERPLPQWHYVCPTHRR
jgi:hypothetical protein